MLIDSHSHLHFPVYKDGIENVLARMNESNVCALTVGTNYENSLEAAAFSQQYGIPCSVGFHPSHARPTGVQGYFDPMEGARDEEFDAGKMRSLLAVNTAAGAKLVPRKDDDQRESKNSPLTSARALAVGECGLDYFRLPDDESFKKQFKQRQREVFEAQIELAREFHLPLIIHARPSKEDPDDAYRDIYEIMRRQRHNVGGVLHCYLGNIEYAQKFLDLGFYLSFSGIVTFKTADTVRAAAAYCPVDRMLTETDCPYLAPEPHRGRQNEPAYVAFVLRTLEALKGVTLEQDIERNFRTLFAIWG